MKFKLNLQDRKKLEGLFDTLVTNTIISDLLIEFSRCDDFFSAKDFIYVKDLKETYLHGFLDFFSLSLKHKSDENIFNDYIRTAFHEVDFSEYKNNPYYVNVRPKPVKEDKYMISYETYKPFQSFVLDDLRVNDETYQEIYSFGFSREAYTYLTLSYDNVNWMLINPNEMNTMKKHIEKATGKVLTLGLGLGYYLYMLLIKEDVSFITVIENDEKVINLFNKYLLNFFPHQEKFKIIKYDAFNYIKNYNLTEYNYIFVDIYHGASDGFYVYKKFTDVEKEKHCHFSFWLENSILAFTRRLMLILMEEQYFHQHRKYNMSKNETDKIINLLYEKTKSLSFTTYEKIVKFLSDDNLKKIIVSL